MIPDISNHYQN